jgi:DNA-binding HxlR family transcriptional regulator
MRKGGERTYGQYCPIAAGLDVVGDRWVLLICRELAMGDRRFTDLRDALPGIAPNLLSERLRALQEAGLVTTVELPPPAARTVYRLTEDGQAVAPVLRAMARFGARYLDGSPSARFDARRAAHAFLVPWRRSVEVSLRARLEVGDGDAVDVVLDGRGTQVVPPEGEPEVVLRTEVADLSAARREGTAFAGRITGRAEARRRFLDAFDLRLSHRPAGRG